MLTAYARETEAARLARKQSAGKACPADFCIDCNMVTKTSGKEVKSFFFFFFFGGVKNRKNEYVVRWEVEIPVWWTVHSNALIRSKREK
jgi:hypothetical protein